jgi:hypothetical protein
MPIEVNVPAKDELTAQERITPIADFSFIVSPLNDLTMDHGLNGGRYWQYVLFDRNPKNTENDTEGGLVRINVP